MRPVDYDINLDGTIYREILFTIDPNQFDCPRGELPYTLEARFDTPEEAKEIALFAANLIGHEVEISVDGYWGYFGREYIESIRVQPTRSA